ncbi:C3 and PZP-like alpha-2-macroglobulin domain-containing protein 8 [Diadema setosum]|uniref:C3 and PZP-like alpha-2-macroglobulin domain-containing protein 8 n=1 Tax=Diadema setosum TaxID=31175 RepID=UPI003B3AF1DD
MPDEEMAIFQLHPTLKGTRNYIFCIPPCPVIYTEDSGGPHKEFAFLDVELSGSALVVDFEVSANHDANIALSSESKNLQKMYRIVIGAHKKRVIVQRECPTPYSTACTVDIAASFFDSVLTGIPTYDHFWLTFDEGRLMIGRHGNQVAFINWTDPDPFPVNHIGVWTGWTSEGY